MARTQTTDEALVARMQTVVAQNSEELAGEPNGFDIQLAPLKWWRENWTDKKVQKLFIENFIKIRSKHEDGKIIPFRLNDVQTDFHFKATGRDVVLKSRQQGFSTYFLAIKFIKSILFSGRNIRFVPHDPDAEDEFWMRLDTMYQNLPSDKKPTTRYYSKELIQFEDVSKNVTDSRLVSMNPRSGQENKLRSQTLTDAHLTEIPFWDGDQQKVFTALMEATDKGDITLESTAQGKEKFHFYYEQGKKRKGGWTSHFYEWWWLRTNRSEGFRFAQIQGKWCLLADDESSLDIWKSEDSEFDNRARLYATRVKSKELYADKKEDDELIICEKILSHLKKLKYVSKDENWHCWEVAEYLAFRRAKIEALGGDDQKRGLKIFLVEHPENDKDCFETSTRTVISPLYLNVTCEPILIPDANATDAEIKLFESKVIGKSFLISADTSLGREDSDPAAIEIIDVDTGRQVHSEELLISPDLLAHRLKELSDWFNGALICVERNNTGVATLKELSKLVEPERIFKELTSAQRRQVEDGKKTYDEAMIEAEFGIATTTANKALFALYLEQAIRTGELGLSNQEWCDQAEHVVWLNAQKTQWGALQGFHDDRFIALAIGNYVRVSRYAEFMGFVGVMPEGGNAR